MSTSNRVFMGIPVEPSAESIDRELSSMWKRHTEDNDGDGGVTRIALGNVLWLGSKQYSPRISRIFSSLVPFFPCRLFILEWDSDREGEELEAQVNATCFAQPELKREVCCEQIHFRFGTEGLRHIPSAVLALLLPDLPTCLWYFSSQPQRYHDILPQLSSYADRVVTEVAYLPQPSDGLRLMAWQDSEAFSMSWFRFLPIREQIASAFDDIDCKTFLQHITKVRIGWMGDGTEPQALTNSALLCGWLASNLGWEVPEVSSWPFKYERQDGQPIEIDFFHKDHEGVEETTQLLEFALEADNGAEMKLRLTDQVGHMERTMSYPGSCCQQTTRFVQVRSHGAAEALGRALAEDQDREPFRRAAEKAWPLLEQALTHLEKP